MVGDDEGRERWAEEDVVSMALSEPNIMSIEVKLGPDTSWPKERGDRKDMAMSAPLVGDGKGGHAPDGEKVTSS